MTANSETKIRSGGFRVTYNDVNNNFSKTYTMPVSEYIGNAREIIKNEPMGMYSYSYQGKIYYNTYNDPYGSYIYNDSLSVYLDKGNTTYEYKDLRVAEGTEASVAIGILALVLSLFCPLLKEAVAASLLFAAAYSAGVTIIGGIVQGMITKRYYVKTTKCNVKARDTKTGREQIHNAEIYQVALDGGGYSSELYYEGYLPWNSDTVAYWMFLDFWSYLYPGVKKYS